MLKKPRSFLTFNRVSGPFVSSDYPSRTVTYKSTKILADYDSRQPRDFVNASKEGEIEDGGVIHSNRGGRGMGRISSGNGGRGAGRGGRSEEMNREVAISKALSKLLRHAATDAGLTLDDEGFARVNQVMKWPRLKSLQTTFEDIKRAVSDNAKQRFSMKPNPASTSPPNLASEEPSDWIIRANQGHSIAIDSAALLVPITLEAGDVPEIVVHGTYFAFYQSILDTGGLKKMTRNHIHFSTGLPDDKQGIISGMRNDAEILIYVDIKKSLEDEEVRWWISENGVILTEGDTNGVLPTKYWKKVIGRKHDVGVLWEDGVQLADLPQTLRNRKAPNGKGPRGRDEGQKPRGRDTRGDGNGRADGSKDGRTLEDTCLVDADRP